jgi:hypothetical protein
MPLETRYSTTIGKQANCQSRRIDIDLMEC